MCQHQPPCPRAGIGSRGRPRHVVSSRAGVEPALQRRRGVRRYRRATSRWPEHRAAPVGPPDGDRPSAPAAAAGSSLRRSSGELTCARSVSANASAQLAGGWSRCHRTRVTPTSLAPSSWPAVPADPCVSRCPRKRRPDQADPPQCHLRPLDLRPNVHALRATDVRAPHPGSVLRRGTPAAIHCAAPAGRHRSRHRSHGNDQCTRRARRRPQRHSRLIAGRPAADTARRGRMPMLAGRPISDNPCSFGSMILTLIT